MKYVVNYNEWSEEAQEKLNVPNESVTISRIEELIDRGFFIKKRLLFPNLSQQKVNFIVLPPDLFDLLTENYFNSELKAVNLSQTGHIWFKGYPVIYEDERK